MIVNIAPAEIKRLRRVPSIDGRGAIGDRTACDAVQEIRLQNDRGSSVEVTATTRFVQWLGPNAGNGAPGVPKPGGMSFAAMAALELRRRGVRRRRLLAQTLACVAIAAAGLAPGHASAAAISVTTLADTTTPNPLGGGPFSGFTRDQVLGTSLGPALDGDVVAFIGGNSLHPGSPFAVSVDGGAITSIANDATLMPGEPDLPTAEFIGFGGFSLDGDTAVFAGSGFKQNIGFGELVGGVYRETGGGLEAVANTATAIPGRAGSFLPSNFGRPSADGGEIAFCVQSTGVYATTAGGLVVVADDATPIPGGVGNFLGNYSPDALSLDGGDVIFTASVPVGPFNHPAIFKTTGGVEGALERVVDTDTAVPGTAELFGALANPALSDGNVVFWGRTASTLRAGIYTTIGGGVRVVADRNTAVPGGTGNFIAFASNAGLSIAGERVAFLGFGEGGLQGIYVWDAGAIRKVIDSNDSIDERSVLMLDFNKEAFSGSAIVFVANFEGDYLEGVYVAPVPEPGGIVMQLAVLGGLFAVARSRAQPKC